MEGEGRERLRIVISEPKPEDAEGILTVFYETWIVTYPNKKVGITIEDVEDKFKDHFSKEKVQKYSERLANPLPNERLLVAKVGGQVVGVIRIVRGKKLNELRSLYVLPEYQGRGIGRALWNEGEKFLDASKETFVYVADYNKKAIAAYRSFGFKETGKRRLDEKFRMKSGSIISQLEMKLQ